MAYYGVGILPICIFNLKFFEITTMPACGTVENIFASAHFIYFDCAEFLD